MFTGRAHPHARNHACVNGGDSPDLTSLESTTQPTILQGFPLLAHHHLHLPTLLLWLERWEGSLFRREPEEEEASPTHRQKRVASDSAPQDWGKRPDWVDFHCSPWVNWTGGHHFFWEYSVNPGAVNSLRTCTRCHLQRLKVRILS